MSSCWFEFVQLSLAKTDLALITNDKPDCCKKSFTANKNLSMNQSEFKNQSSLKKLFNDIAIVFLRRSFVSNVIDTLRWSLWRSLL